MAVHSVLFQNSNKDKATIFDEIFIRASMYLYNLGSYITSLRLSDAYASVNLPSLVQIMACRLTGAKPLSEPLLKGILLIGPLGTNLCEILIANHIFSFTKVHFKMSSGKWRPFCLGLNVLNLRSLGSDSILHKTLYHNISQCFEAATSCDKMGRSLWNLTGGSVAWLTNTNA